MQKITINLIQVYLFLVSLSVLAQPDISLVGMSPLTDLKIGTEVETIVIDFNMTVKNPSASLTLIKLGTPVEEVELSIKKFHSSKKSIRLTLNEHFEYDTDYQIKIVDLTDISDASNKATVTHDFKTMEAVKPDFNSASTNPSSTSLSAVSPYINEVIAKYDFTAPSTGIKKGTGFGVTITPDGMPSSALTFTDTEVSITGGENVVIDLSGKTLEYDTKYEVKITAVQSNEDAENFADDVTFEFTTESATKPYITSIETNKADDISLSPTSVTPYITDIVATYSKPTNSNGIKGGTDAPAVTIKPVTPTGMGAALTNVLVSVSGQVVTIDVSGSTPRLQYGTKYNLEIKDAISDEAANNKADDKTYEFTTKAVPLPVLNTGLSTKGIDVDPYLKKIIAAFDVGDDSGGIESATDITVSFTGGTLTQGTDYDVSYDGNNVELSIKTHLEYSTTYTVSLKNVKSKEDLNVVAYKTTPASFSFTTEAAIKPSLEKVETNIGTNLTLPPSFTSSISPYITSLIATYKYDDTHSAGVDAATVKITPVKDDNSDDASAPVVNVTKVDFSNKTLAGGDKATDVSIELGGLIYGQKYKVELTDVTSNEDAENKAVTTVLYFKTANKVAPKISSVTGISSDGATDISPYLGVLELVFDDPGVKDNGTRDEIKLSGVVDASPNYSAAYSTKGIVITLNDPLKFNDVYTISLTNIQSNETLSNEAASLSYSFTTTASQPSVTGVTSSQSLCNGKESAAMGFTIQEGHRGNFHKDGASTRERVTIKIREKGGVETDKFNFEAAGSVSTSGMSDLKGTETKLSGTKTLLVEFKTNSAISFEKIDLLEVKGVKIKYSGIKSADDAGDYELYISNVTESFRGLQDEVVGEFTLYADDDAFTISAVGAETGVSPTEFCANENITISTSTPSTAVAADYDFYKENVLNHTGTSWTTTTISEGNKVYAQSKGTCPVRSNTLTFDMVEIHNYKDIKYAVYDPEDATKVDIIAYDEKIVKASTDSEFRIEALDPSNKAIKGTFYDVYGTSNPPIREDAGNTYWSPAKAQLFADNAATGQSLFYARFYQQCTNKVDINYARFGVNLYDPTKATQLSSAAISEGTICKDEEDAIPVTWVPSITIADLELKSLSGFAPDGSPLPNLITIGTVTNAETGIATSVYLIKPSEAGSYNNVDIVIEYSLGTGTTASVSQITQKLRVGESEEPRVFVLGSASQIASVQCEQEDPVELYVPENGTQLFFVKDLDTNIETPLEEEQLYFRAAKAGEIVTPLKAGNFLVPNTNGYELRVEHRNESNCMKERVYPITVYSGPAQPPVSFTEFCVGDGSAGFIPALDMTPAKADSATYYSLAWVDGDNILGTGWKYEAKIRNDQSSTANYAIKLKDASTGCLSTESQVIVTVGENPEASFDYQVTNDQKVWMEEHSTGAAVGADRIVQWDYEVVGTTDKLQRLSPLAASAKDELSVSNTGIQTLQLKVTTQLGCEDIIQQEVTVPGYGTPTGDQYTARFDTGDTNDWVPTSSNENSSTEAAVNSTWKMTEDLDGHEYVWQATGNGEYSWVESPLIDLSHWSAPLVSMDLFYDTPSLEGIALQYRVVGQHPDENGDWELVGSAEAGLHRYNSTSISAGPGGSIIGWTGQSEGVLDDWVKVSYDLSKVKAAAISLADSKGRPITTGLFVQFRVAYASLNLSTARTTTGVAFDSFTIHNKTRHNLVEHVTNLNATGDNQKAIIDEFVNTRRASSVGSEDLIYIQYHSFNPQPDELHYGYHFARNSSSHHSLRASYNVGTTMINGTGADEKNFNDWGELTYSQQAVQEPAFDVSLSYDKSSYVAGENLKVTASAVRNSVPYLSLDTASLDLLMVLNVAVVEKEVTASDGTIHHNVLVKLLPRYPADSKWADWDASLGESLSAEEEWDIPVDADPDRFALIAWVELTNTSRYTDGNVKILPEIFQAEQVNIDIALSKSSVVANVSKLEQDNISLYPVPTSGELTIQGVAGLIPVSTWTIVDVTGQVSKQGQWQAVSSEQKLDVSDLKSGTYLLQLRSREGVVTLRFVKE
ncbi:Ig-like domain-containing protein [Reichenbachiella versicolor]|uniref:Ig-like domain-containing protein n=1 Tax=Reichenbachiella versicolor TaxID=1821036 RepID=UPI000D6E21AF|nr:Ig-like domain-containing protein [Reichenbachiella versicolor]